MTGPRPVSRRENHCTLNLDISFKPTDPDLTWLLLRDSAVPMGIKDTQGNYLLVNAPLRNLACTRWSEGDDILDSHLFPPPMARRIRQADKRLIQDASVFTEEFELDCPDHKLPVLVVEFPILGADAEVIAIGLLVIDSSRRDGHLDASARALARSEQANNRLQKTLRELEVRATTDRLTGAWNRAWLEETLVNEVSRAERYGHPLSILLLDLDHFKLINDEHGHAVGDTVLREFARRIGTCDRGPDSLVRWGGEEFVVLCPNTPLHSAAMLAERIRFVIGERRFADVGRVTCSVGVAEFMVGETWMEWFSRADAALYRAKNAGRDRVDLAPETRDDVDGTDSRYVQLVWRRAYECGHDEIDAQHQDLFRVTNKLLDAVLGERPDDELATAVKHLLDKLAEHFRHEEKIIRAAGFPGAEAHAAVHDDLLERAHEMLTGFITDGRNIGELFVFLAQDIVTRHLLRADRQFFPHLATASA